MKAIFTSPQLEVATKLNYEPKSVLDLRRSPSPDDQLALSNQLQDWDSLMQELGLHDDSQPLLLPDLIPSFHPTHFTPFHHHFADADDYNNNQSPDFIDQLVQLDQSPDFIDQLVQLAECFDTNSPQLAHSTLTRLNHIPLPALTAKPLHRAAYYFKEALQTLLTGSARPSDIIQTIKAYKIFSNISPIPMFSNFTANQAILDAMNGSVIVHVIDFDIGLGGQWASFIKEIAETRKAVVIRITAIVLDEYGVISELIRQNLCQFAGELNIGFKIEFVSVKTFELLSFEAIRIDEAEKLAVVLSPTIIRRIGVGFVNDLRRVSPHVIVNLDSEGLITPSFRQTVVEGLEFYSTILESLEVANVGAEWIRRIERFLLLPKITAAIETAGNRATPWREVFIGVGLRPVGFSRFADFQAECLLSRVQIRGFHVAKQQAEMLLCWHDRALVATSAWRC